MRLTPQQIESWVKKNFQYKMASGGKQIRINNPFDNSDDDYHMWISLTITALKKGPIKGTKNYWVHDFRGTYASTFIGFVKRYLHTSKGQAFAAVANGKIDPSMYLVEDEEVEEVETILELPPGSKPIIGSPDSKARGFAVGYLNNRGVDLVKIDKYKIHFTVSSVVFPYFEYGNIVYWQERNLMNKIFMFPDSSTGTKKTDFLYGFDMVNPESTLYIVESIFNCISIGDSCLASGGAILAGEQLDRLKMLRPKGVVLAPDNDKAGIMSLVRNYYQLKDLCPLFYSIPIGIDDWNDIEQKTRDSRKVMLKNVKKMDLVAIVRLQELLARLSK